MSDTNHTIGIIPTDDPKKTEQKPNTDRHATEPENPPKPFEPDAPNKMYEEQLPPENQLT